MALFFFLLLLFLPLTLTLAQPTSVVNCNDVLLTYNVSTWEKIRPFYPSDLKSQPYSFTATATILNSGTTDLLAWAYLIGFSHRELIVSVNPGVLTSSAPLPFNSSATAGPVSFSGFPNPDLKTPIETTNDLKIQLPSPSTTSPSTAPKPLSKPTTTAPSPSAASPIPTRLPPLLTLPPEPTSSRSETETYPSSTASSNPTPPAISPK